MHRSDLDRLLASVASGGPELLGRRHLKNAAVIVPLVETGGTYHFLFEKRAAHIPQGSEICFPGGEFDARRDRTLADTALRETEEELGIDRRRIDIKCKLGTVIAMRGIAIDCFVAVLDIPSADAVTADRSEVQEVFLLPVSWFEEHAPGVYAVAVELHPSVCGGEGGCSTLLPARELGLPPKYWKSWRGADRTVMLYSTVKGPVWGVTAEIIDAMMHQMGRSCSISRSDAPV